MKRVIFILLIILFFSVHFLTAKENFPFIAESKAKNVNVRAGGNINFESICKLDEGEKVVVIEKEYNWFKIQLPKKSVCYINSAYIKERQDNLGEVTADKVNLRSEANQNCTVLSQLNEGDEVKIIEKINDWYEIKAPSSCFGWVYDKFLTFHSSATKPEKHKITKTPSEIIEKEGLRQQPQKAQLITPQKEYTFDATGIVRPIFCMFNCKAAYKLVDINNKTICFLEADRLILKKFVNFKVRILGIKRSQMYKIYPIIKVKKINIMQ